MAETNTSGIRRARRAAGLTQQQVADHLHLSKGTICGWERGHYRPDPTNARRLMALLPGLTFDDIYPVPEAA